jgi:hypothetical protein
LQIGHPDALGVNQQKHVDQAHLAQGKDSYDLFWFGKDQDYVRPYDSRDLQHPHARQHQVPGRAALFWKVYSEDGHRQNYQEILAAFVILV